jgi:hypothetical protein
LLLGGSSLPLSALKDFISFLLSKGVEVASIENPIGGPLDIHIDPVQERLETLREYLDYLQTSEQVQAVDVVAQSYAAFEVVRLLTAEPSYANLIRSIILVNPPGFDSRNNIFKHSFRFLFGHLLKGYFLNLTRMWRTKFSSSGDDDRKQFMLGEVDGNTLWARKTFRNMARTLRELIDITSYRIKEPVRALQQQGILVHLFLQEDDQVVPVALTMKEVKGVIPEQQVKVVPGGHNDLFFQQWQRESFFDFFLEVRGH